MLHSTNPGNPAEFGFLQMRPLSLLRESEALTMDEGDRERAFCWSQSVLGNGRVEGIRDLVVVDFKKFERAQRDVTRFMADKKKTQLKLK